MYTRQRIQGSVTLVQSAALSELTIDDSLVLIDNQHRNFVLIRIKE